MRLILFGLLAVTAFAAGNVQTTNYQLGNTNTWVAAFNWTADTDGSVPVTKIPLANCCQGYNVSVVETVPNSPSPTSGYAVAITDGAGVDVLGGAGVALSSSAAQSFGASPAATPIQGTLNLVLTGNSVSGAKGAIYVFMSKPGTFNASLIGRLPYLATGYVLDASDTSHGGQPYPTLASACVAANAAGALLVVSLFWNNLNSQTLNCSLMPIGSGRLRPASGQTITLNGAFTADLALHLDTSAGGAFAAGASFQATSINPIWFGAVPVQTMAQVAAQPAQQAFIQAAVDSFPGFPTELTRGLYKVTTSGATPAITLNGQKTAGTNSPRLYSNGTENAAFLVAYNTNAHVIGLAGGLNKVQGVGFTQYQDPGVTGVTGAIFIDGYYDLTSANAMQHNEISGNRFYSGLCNEVTDGGSACETWANSHRAQYAVRLRSSTKDNLFNDIHGNKVRWIDDGIRLESLSGATAVNATVVYDNFISDTTNAVHVIASGEGKFFGNTFTASMFGMKFEGNGVGPNPSANIAWGNEGESTTTPYYFAATTNNNKISTVQSSASVTNLGTNNVIENPTSNLVTVDSSGNSHWCQNCVFADGSGQVAPVSNTDTFDQGFAVRRVRHNSNRTDAMENLNLHGEAVNGLTVQSVYMVRAESDYTASYTNPMAYWASSHGADPSCLGMSNSQDFMLGQICGAQNQSSGEIEAQVLSGSTVRARFRANGTGIQLVSGNSATVCVADTRGSLRYVAAGAGVADTYEVCTKDAANNYAWRTVF